MAIILVTIMAIVQKWPYICLINMAIVGQYWCLSEEMSKCISAVVYRNVPPTRNSGQKQNQNSRNGHFLCILSDFENHILEDPFHLEFKAFSDVLGIRGAWRMRAVCKLIENPRFCIDAPPPYWALYLLKQTY